MKIHKCDAKVSSHLWICANFVGAKWYNNTCRLCGIYIYAERSPFDDNDPRKKFVLVKTHEEGMAWVITMNVMES